MRESSVSPSRGPSNPRRTLEFGDIEAFRAHLRGWDTEAVQLDPGHLRLGLDFVDCDDVRVSRLRVNRAVADTSWVEPGWVSFVVTMGHDTRKRWCGLEVGPGHLVVMVPGREYGSVLAPGWDSLEISLRAELAAEIDARFAEDRLGEWVPENGVLALASSGPARLRRFCRDSFAGTDGAASPARLRGGVIATVSELLQTSTPRGGTVRSRWHDLVGEALGRIDRERGQRRLPVADLATALGTTPRNLQYAFRSHLGVSPAQYEVARRLGHARAHLTDPRDTRGVARVASDSGFNHFGRFSQQYRAMFGETPSTTLRRARELGRAHGLRPS